MRISLVLTLLAACGGARPIEHEADGDGDHISDRDDLCPKEAEDLDADVDRDGCPETDCDDCCSFIETRIVPFHPSSAMLARAALETVAVVATELNQRAEIRTIELAGAPGPFARLRAVAVRDELGRLGVSPSRVVIAETPPKDRDSPTADFVGVDILDADCPGILDADDEP